VSDKAGALDGIMVVDLSWGQPGPLAGGQLADHGASVIRVERPGGDPYRSMAARAVYDRGKRGLVLNLRDHRGREVLHRLLDRADVLIESFRPGVADDLGIGYEALHAAYPGLVYCSISGYGQEGSARDQPGYGSLVAARAGVMTQVATSDGAPVYPGVPIGAIGAGLLAVIGITAALVERENTGVGQRVETSLFDGLLSFTNMFWEELENLPDIDQESAIPPNRRLFVRSVICGDGEYLGVHTGANGSHARLMEAMGLSGQVPPAPGNREKTVPLTDEESEILSTEIPRLFASKPRSFWLDKLREYDVCAIPVLRPGEAFSQPQAVHNEIVIEVEDPDLGQVAQVGVAARLASTPGTVRRPAPRVGEHTADILSELGYDIATVADYRRDGVVD
jgi:crotonobetainyl-CoA:carnitine CoA-transferase CaiB-like acyl-CoA transferase